MKCDFDFADDVLPVTSREEAGTDLVKDEASGSCELFMVPVETSTDSSSASSEPLSSVAGAVPDTHTFPIEEVNCLATAVSEVTEPIVTEMSVATETTEKAEHVDQQDLSSIAVISAVLPPSSEVTVEKGVENASNSDDKLDDTADAPLATIVRSEPEKVENVDDSSTGTASARKRSVRIDNFQRPLTDKLLFEWLKATLGYELSKEVLWMNKIKTHCYIDFDSLELAEACIAAVTGLKVNSKHTQHLVASMTEISAAQAETSVEGNMKPNEWKNSQSSTQKLHSLPPSTGSLNKGQGPGYQTKTDHGIGVGNFTILDISNRTLSSSSNSLSNDNSNKAGYGHQIDNSESIRGNTQIGFSTKRNSSAAGLTEEAVKRQNTGIISTSSLRVMREKEKERDQPVTIIDQQDNFGDTVELDTLFRKTISLPPLYWLPVSTDIVSKRKLLQVQS